VKEFELASLPCEMRIGGVNTGRPEWIPRSSCIVKVWNVPAWISKCLILWTVPGLLTCSCSTFNRDWKEAAKQSPPTDSIEGRWEGRWLSDVNGHTGKLLCLLSPESHGNYEARFRAAYWKVFRFSYAVPLRFQQRDTAWHFTGDEDLGKLAGGICHYEGQVTPRKFFSTYWSKYDHGTFQMERPK